MTREEMDKLVLWNSGGNGFGICTVAATMMWAMDRPGPNNPDYPSIVAVNGKPRDYTDEEMVKIVDFAQRVTARHDAMFRYRRGANLIIFGKPVFTGGHWLCKRMSWEYGPMTAPTLDEAIAFMTRASHLEIPKSA